MLYSKLNMLDIFLKHPIFVPYFQSYNRIYFVIMISKDATFFLFAQDKKDLIISPIDVSTYRSQEIRTTHATYREADFVHWHLMYC